MRKSSLAAAVAAVIMIMTQLAAPAVAQDSWEMPDVRGEVLANAVEGVRDATGDVELDLRFLPRNVNQEVLNLSNWAVCATSPARGAEISQKTRRVLFSVRRLNESC